MLKKVILIKIGGSTLGSHDTTIEDIVKLRKEGKSLVVVHGGGALITEWLKKQGVPTTFVQGERVTDKPTLEVATAVLAGLVNKDIVASLNGLGGRAVGISGVDGALIEGRITNKEKGYVGTTVRVNTGILETLLAAGFIPVVAPIGINAVDKPADAPSTLNFNADIVAGEIAAAIGAERLIFLTDVPGINDKEGTRLPSLSPAVAEALIASGVASGGMIPKIKACLTAVSGKSTSCIIDGRQPHALLKEIEGKSSGTVIKA
ncbi:MAG: acetylglutamate kinase [Chloroflexi bacterium]|nr:acetylglutamate kinase [Chloroflexota bacterium]